MTLHDPIFSRFAPPPVKGDIEGFHQDYSGAVFRTEFFDPVLFNVDRPDFEQVGTDKRLVVPELNQEYFEWLDLLETLESSAGRYTFVELGAGFGRWCTRAAVMARRLGKQCRAVAYEADPVHFQWLQKTVLDNELAGPEFSIHQMAVGVTSEPQEFYVGKPDAQGGIDPRGWYGQSLVPEYHHRNVEKLQNDYNGEQAYEDEVGWKSITVLSTTLDQILQQETCVDLLDMDVQGAERHIIPASIKSLSDKVKRLHIGTHSNQIDADLIATMSDANWLNVRTYLSKHSQETPVGTIAFQDGIQTWMNPKFL